MQETVIQWFAQIPDWLSVVLLSALPITELRASIPVALFYYNFSPTQAFIFSILGNAIPFGVIFLIFPHLLIWMQKYSPSLHHLMNKHLNRLEWRYADKYHKWGAIFLFLFVAIPIPGSGVWTGSLIAIIFGMKPKLSIPAILLGMCVSAVIVLLISLGIVSFPYANFI